MDIKKRVLHINNNTFIGGQQMVFLNILKNINKEKYDIDIAVYNSRGILKKEIEKYNCNIFNIPSITRHPIKHYFSLKKIIAEGNYDIVHQHASDAGILINLIIAKKLNVKKVIVHSHAKNSKYKIMHLFLRMFIPLFSNVKIACSEEAGLWLFNKNYEVINNGIDISNYKYDNSIREYLRKKYNIEDNTIVIGHVGRFDTNKNQIFLINMFKKYLDLNDNSLLILIGIGSLLENVKKEALKLGINDKILFLGEKEDANKLYNMFDIFVLPSFNEGNPLTLIEALTNGLNCICNIKLPNIDNTIRIKLDPNLWAEKISNLSIKRNKYNINNYSNKSFINKIEKIYDEK